MPCFNQPLLVLHGGLFTTNFKNNFKAFIAVEIVDLSTVEIYWPQRSAVTSFFTFTGSTKEQLNAIFNTNLDQFLLWDVVGLEPVFLFRECKDGRWESLHLGGQLHDRLSIICLTCLDYKTSSSVYWLFQIICYPYIINQLDFLFQFISTADWQIC